MPSHAHPSVLRFLKEYRPKLTVEFMPSEADPGFDWCVCEPVMQATDVGGGLVVAQSRPFPILRIMNQQAMEVDQRVVQQLERARFETMADPFKEYQDEQYRMIRETDDYCEAWAKDHYRQYLKAVDGWNFANVPKVNPSDSVKRRQDQLGRDPRVPWMGRG